MAKKFDLVIYLMSDFKDPSAARRITGLKELSERILIGGFSRSIYTLSSQITEETIQLGTAGDGRYIARLVTLLTAIWRLRKFPRLTKRSIIWARNTDMLILGTALYMLNRGRPQIVWELLDISRLQTSRKFIGHLTRIVDRLLCRLVALVVVSSPAFITNYLTRVLNEKTQTFVWENKMPRGFKPIKKYIQSGRSVDIVLAGKFRCDTSIQLLGQLTELLPELSIELWGVPAPNLSIPLPQLLSRFPRLNYKGRFLSPSDLAEVYSRAKLSWGIDLSGAGLNSDWLLPNRLYEAASYGVPTIALAGTFLAETVEQRGLGIVVDSLDLAYLGAKLTAQVPASIRNSVGAARHSLVEDDEPLVVARLLDVSATR